MTVKDCEILLDQVKFDSNGLVGAIVQDHQTGEVLMFAWMNRESLSITLTQGNACYWSRSRQKLWLKGETSGNMQAVKSIRLDCDGDALLVSVEQKGGACHTGHRSCFYRVEDDGRWREDSQPVFDASSVYGKTSH